MAALELSEKGKSGIVLEMNHVIGGRISSWHKDGMLVESGLHRNNIMLSIMLKY